MSAPDSTRSFRARVAAIVGYAAVPVALFCALAALTTYSTGLDLVCARGLLCRATSSPGVASQIHLSWTSDPARSMTVSWRAESKAEPAVVEYRPAGRSPWQRATGVRAAMPASGLLRHRGAMGRVELAGLSPATLYEYRIANDGDAPTDWSPIRRFRTAPAGDDASYRLGFFADCGLIGRVDGLSDGAETVLSLLRAEGLLFVLGGGDYAYANRDGRFTLVADAIDEWFRQWQPLLGETPLMAQYGNHEIFLDERFADWAPRLAHPPGWSDGRAYSFDVGAAHFTAMYAPGQGHLPSRRLLDWLDRDLEAARSRGQSWLVVFQHAPIFAVGRSHPADPRLRDALVPILERHRVDLHLSAHDQSYERTYPLVDAGGTPQVSARDASEYAAGEGVVYAKISPAGKRSEIGADFSKFTEEQAAHVARRSDSGHHYAVVSVEGRRELRLRAYRVEPGHAEATEIDSVRLIRR